MCIWKAQEKKRNQSFCKSRCQLIQSRYENGKSRLQPLEKFVIGSVLSQLSEEGKCFCPLCKHCGLEKDTFGRFYKQLYSLCQNDIPAKWNSWPYINTIEKNFWFHKRWFFPNQHKVVKSFCKNAKLKTFHPFRTLIFRIKLCCGWKHLILGFELIHIHAFRVLKMLNSWTATLLMQTICAQSQNTPLKRLVFSKEYWRSVFFFSRFSFIQIKKATVRSERRLDFLKI